MTNDIREAVARIIAPGAFALRDAYRVRFEPPHTRAEDAVAVGLAKADAILALLKPADDAHPEDCRRCGARNPGWSAPSPLWNAVMRGGTIDGEPLFEDMVCATCFMAIAEERGIAIGWRVDAVDVRAPLETITPSGRIWDAGRWLWVDLPAERGEARVNSLIAQSLETGNGE